MGFAADNEAHDGVERIICEISLSDNYVVRDTAAYSLAEIGASPTLYLCDFADPDTDGSLSITSQPYFPLISNHSWKPAKAAYGDQPTDAEAWIEIDNLPYPWQRRLSFGYANRESSDAVVKLSQILSQYRIEGITIWSVIGAHSGATPSTQQIFKGRLYQPQIVRGKIRLSLTMNKDWDVTFPSKGKPTGGTGPAYIDRVSWPDAPANVIGQTIPLVCCGDPTQDLLGLSDYQLLTINPQLLHGLAPMVMTAAKHDAGTSSVGRVHGNMYPSLGTPVDGIGMVLFSVPELNTLAVMDGSSPSVDSHEASYKIGLNEYATVVINPKIHVSAVNVDDPQKAWDGKHDTYAVVKGATGDLKLTVPSVGYLGAISSIYAFAFLGYASAARGNGIDTGAGGTSVNGVVGIWEETFGAWYGGTNKNLTKDDIENGTIRKSNAVNYAGLTSPNVNNWAWEYVRAGVPNQLNFRIQSNVAGVNIRVYSCGFLVTFIPQNIFREVHRKQRVPIVGVNGRVSGWREV